MAMDKKTLHCNMLVKINAHINDKLGNLKMLKQKLEVILDPVDVAPNTDMLDIFKAMEHKGYLAVGEYHYLKSVLKDEFVHVFKMVEQTEREMKGDPEGLEEKRKDDERRGSYIKTKASDRKGGYSGSSKMEASAGSSRAMEIDKKQLHANLLAELSEHISNDIGNLEKLKQKLRGSKLTPADLARNKSTIEVLHAMEKRRLLAVGDYAYLKDVLADDHEDVLDIVKETEKKMEGGGGTVKEDGNKPEPATITEVGERKEDFSSSSKQTISPAPTKKRRRSSENDGGSGGSLINVKRQAPNIKPEISSGAPRWENFRKMEESALPFEEIYNLVQEGVYNQIGNINIPGNNHVKGSQGTGFRVGTNFIMSAYHVFQPMLDYIWGAIARIIWEKLDKDKRKPVDKYVGSLAHYLEVTIEQTQESDKEKLTCLYLYKWRNSFSPRPSRTINHLIEQFEDMDHGTLPDEIRKVIAGLSSVAEVTFGQFRKDGVGQTKFMLDLNVPYFSVVDDVILVRLVDDGDAKFPKPFTLEASVSSNMHLLGHPDNKLLQFDSGCQVYTYEEQALLERDITEAKKHCEPLCKNDYSKTVLINEYDDILKGFVERRYVVFHSSRSIAHGASGCPGLVVVAGKPKVQMMLQRGHPGCVYDELSKEDLKNLPAKCLFESGLSMKRVEELLSFDETKTIRDDIFKKHEEKMEH